MFVCDHTTGFLTFGETFSTSRRFISQNNRMMPACGTGMHCPCHDPLCALPILRPNKTLPTLGKRNRGTTYPLPISVRYNYECSSIAIACIANASEASISPMHRSPSCHLPPFFTKDMILGYSDSFVQILNGVIGHFRWSANVVYRGLLLLWSTGSAV